MSGLIDIFEFAWFCFTVDFTIFGFSFSFFDIAIALFAIGLVFLIIRRITDL